MNMVGQNLPKLVKEPIGEFPSRHSRSCLHDDKQIQQRLDFVAQQACLPKYKKSPVLSTCDFVK